VSCYKLNPLASMLNLSLTQPLLPLPSPLSIFLPRIPVSWEGPMTCKQWDCECAYTRQRGCCCAANDMFQLEDDIFKRIHYLWHNISTLKYRVHDYTGEHTYTHRQMVDCSLTYLAIHTQTISLTLRWRPDRLQSHHGSKCCHNDSWNY